VRLRNVWSLARSRSSFRKCQSLASALAYNYINQDDWFIAPKTAGPKARRAAQKALELDESNAEAHVVLAIESQWYEWDWAGAERGFKRAIELNPDNADARGYYSWFLPIMGRGDEAVAEAKRGLQTDPLSTGLNGNLGSVFVFTHQWDKAIEQLRTSIDLDPNYWFDHYYLGRAYEQKGRCVARAYDRHALSTRVVLCPFPSGRPRPGGRGKPQIFHYATLSSSNRSLWKRRSLLCHPERSRGICSSADLSWKCFSTALRSHLSSRAADSLRRVGMSNDKACALCNSEG
jgi:Tfp pilus assembly protein PilF